MADYRYPLDLSGTNSANKVKQTRTLNMTTKNGDSFFIPADAPFFGDSVVIIKNGTNTPLTEGLDYELIFDFPDIFDLTQKKVYGGVKFKDRKMTGQVTITMQVVGGEFLQPVQNILETTARNKTNVSTATWGELAGVPAAFPVLDHTNQSTDLVGFNELNISFKEWSALLLEWISGGTGNNSNNMLSLLQAHINNNTSAHSKSAVGLGNVPNYSIATFDEADLGVNNKLITPGIVKYLIGKYSGISEINAINTSIIQINKTLLTISTSQQQLGEDQAKLNTSYKTVVESFNLVKNEFANLKLYIQDLTVNIETVNQTINTIKLQVDNSLEKVQSMQSKVENISTDNLQIKTNLATLSADLETIKLDISGLGKDLRDLTTRVDQVFTTLIYPNRRFISTGTYHFSIKPGQTRQVSLYAPGGGGGMMIPIGEEDVSDARGDNATDSILYLNTDTTNGTPTVGKIILRALGGRGGFSTTQAPTGIEKYGKGGAGGKVYVDNFATSISQGVGSSGIDGGGDATGSHAGAKGQTVQGIPIGDGGASNKACGSGGAGGFVVATIKNTFDFDLMFTMQIGTPGKNASANDLLEAKPGLGIIEII